jgi:hypothetical protein
MRKILAAVAACCLLAACDSTPSATRAEGQAQQGVSQQLVQNQPIPGIRYSQMRQNLVEIEEAEAKGVQTTTFMFGGFFSDPVQVCPSIGVPIPNTASLSNPDQPLYAGYHDSAVIAQMDPNGVYAPSSSSGTFVQCVGGNGQVEPVYAEGVVHSVFGPATWDYTHHAVVMTGPASFKFTAGQQR